MSATLINSELHAFTFAPFSRLSINLTTETATVDGIYLVARIVDDSDPDTSYLDQDDFSDRLTQYERGDFDYRGVVVAAYDEDDNEITAASLWGIESDSGAEYFREVANELAAEVGLTPA